MAPASKEEEVPVILLPVAKRLAVLSGLVEGNSERAIERMTGVNRETVGRFGLRFGGGAQRLHDRLVRDLACNLVDVDEIWAFCTKKGTRVTPKDSPDIGEAWTWVALDRSSRLSSASTLASVTNTAQTPSLMTCARVLS